MSEKILSNEIIKLNETILKWMNKYLCDVTGANYIKDMIPIYQDRCDKKIIATVYKNKLDSYFIKSFDNELCFKTNSIIEVLDCILDISKTFKVYGICWILYDKIRKSIGGLEYDKYSIYVSNYNDNNGKWIINKINHQL